MPIFPDKIEWLRLFIFFGNDIYGLTVAEAIWWCHYLALVEEVEDINVGNG